MDNEIKECLTSIEKLPEIVAKAAEENIHSSTIENELLDAAVAILTSKGLLNIPKELIGGECSIKILDEEAFKTAQKAVMESFLGEWQESDATIALAAYVESGGQFEGEPTVQLTLGELYGLEESDELYTVEAKLNTAQRNKLPDSAFCGPNRSFPVNDRAHAVAALRLIGRYKGPGDKSKIRACVVRKAAKFGVGPNAKKEALDILPVVFQLGESVFVPYRLESKEDLETFLAEAGTVATALNLDDSTQEQLKKFLDFCLESEKLLFDEDLAALYESEDVECDPVTLGPEDVQGFFEANKAEEDYLLPFVATVRKLNIEKHQIEEAQKAYQFFDKSVLRCLLSKPLSGAKSTNVEDNSIQTQAGQVVETEEVVKDKEKKTDTYAAVNRVPGSRRAIRKEPK